ncbi:MAG: DUF3667 domain-containing protein [Bacteroidales bacterium]|nr:DUF3667 domain-containing protein [Bacteroidales bacterium]
MGYFKRKLRRTRVRAAIFWRKTWYYIQHPKEGRVYDNTGMEKEHTCLACKLRYKGRYCPRCGQSADTQRFTIKNIFDKTLEVWDYNEKSVFGTVLELIYRPGYLISDYLKGKRSSYYPPIKLLFFLCVALAIVLNLGFVEKRIEQSHKNDKATESAEEWLMELSNSFDTLDQAKADSVAVDSVRLAKENIVIGLSERSRKAYAKSTAHFSKLIRNYNLWRKQNRALHILLVNLLISFLSWRIFRKTPRNAHLSYTEHIFIQVFISAQLIFFSIIYMLFWGTFLPDQDRFLLPEWFFFLVYVIDRRQLFGTSWFKTLYKTVLIQVLYYVCIFFIVILSSVLLFLIDSLFI